MSWVEKNRKINNRGKGGGRLFGTREYVKDDFLQVFICAKIVFKKGL